SRDVSITQDGAYAVVRRDESPDVGVVSLLDGSRVVVTLSGPVTDLDLSDDGTRAIAVVRAPGTTAVDAGAPEAGAGGAAGAAGTAGAAGAAGANADAGADAIVIDAGPPPSSEVFVLPIPGIVTSPAQFDTVKIDGEVVGSVSISESGGIALLYTNAIPN